MSNTAKSGFTVTELVVAMAIFSLASLGIGKLLVEFSGSSFVTAEKLDINADIRQFTLDMSENARASNSFFLYRSFQPSDRNAPSDRLRDGKSGDFLLLVYHEPWPTVSSDIYYTRLVGYFRDADPSNPSSEGPVKRFEKVFHDPNLSTPPAGSAGPYVKANAPGQTLEALLNDLSISGTYQTIVQLSLGLADGQLFYNNREQSIMVEAQIIHGNVAKRITDTYNYTVSPRG